MRCFCTPHIFTQNYDAHRLATNFKFNHLTSWDIHINITWCTFPFVFFLVSTY